MVIIFKSDLPSGCSTILEKRGKGKGLKEDKYQRVQIIDTHGNIVLVNACSYCYKDPDRITILAEYNTSNFGKHLQAIHQIGKKEDKKQRKRISFNTAPVEITKLTDKSIIEDLNKAIKTKVGNDFWCEDDKLVSNSLFNSVNSFIDSGSVYQITGCWVPKQDKMYKEFLEMKIPKRKSEDMALHSVLCELGRDVYSYSDAHIRCCRPSHLRWGTAQDNNIDQDIRRLIQEDPDFISLCTELQSKTLELYDQYDSFIRQVEIIHGVNTITLGDSQTSLREKDEEEQAINSNRVVNHKEVDEEEASGTSTTTTTTSTSSTLLL